MAESKEAGGVHTMDVSGPGGLLQPGRHGEDFARFLVGGMAVAEAADDAGGVAPQVAALHALLETLAHPAYAAYAGDSAFRMTRIFQTYVIP